MKIESVRGVWLYSKRFLEALNLCFGFKFDKGILLGFLLGFVNDLFVDVLLKVLFLNSWLIINYIKLITNK